MRVHLRQRRQKNGKISLYLEIYKGYLKTNNKTNWNISKSTDK